ncbi:nucleotidyl transferase AbiEii/AbiGii toxin family protein [Candidatus Peregrinibacteria bacterium]|nr:nucleotidyl transferase AbiEii/AbiGii toxin family protein [Candidatus Peregrinibacteria bacterium]
MSSQLLENKLVFCGGFVLLKEGFSERYTRDVDMICSGSNHEEIIEEIKMVINKDLGDGIWFGDTLVEKIQEGIHYGGVRFRPLYKVGLPSPSKDDIKKLRRVHLDLSFQSISSQMSISSVMSGIIEGFENISWCIYPVEFTAADKLHALISREGLSSRAKDVYDLSLILIKCDKKKLRFSLSHTFSVRKTTLDQSVLRTLKNLGTYSLQQNWPKLEIKNKKFDECWNNIIDYFDKF